MNSLELFVGAGGMAMGITNAGYEHKAVVEWDKNACNTIRYNKERLNRVVSKWPLFETDVRNFDFANFEDSIDLLAGGPPCQPFSLGGKHLGLNDGRNMFPEMIRAIREIRPKVVFIENVKGLLRKSFNSYFEYILLQINYPDVIQRDGESWYEHLSRLEEYHTSGKQDGLCYRTVFRLVNAADYGIPQRRERVLIVAFRRDLNVNWSFPNPTHSQDALIWSQWVTGDYWEINEVSTSQRPELTPKIKSKINKLYKNGFPLELPWRTIRETILDLPDPETNLDNRLIHNHEYRPGARIYSGHTGSPIDEPAKTLKAGDHGVPGGENMLVHVDGRVRYFTIRESARLQTFPDDYIFQGSWTESMRQLGNAVPVRLAEMISNSIKAHLKTPVCTATH
ncbi:DNA cytosine methyltransferase [Brevibacillus parabrevis]|uniref:DNA cytosine methyltransferase n=1 Tax=Brevibacillus parabrevis TaxID=54914 RepID=UPI0028536E12|nr:DNA cytosine methyltransferase [Brevibacillus parabrevis]MDR4997401.1 DNA cytosine methyltransferase [Brevibacillus parabrevis]